MWIDFRVDLISRTKTSKHYAWINFREWPMLKVFLWIYFLEWRDFRLFTEGKKQEVQLPRGLIFANSQFWKLSRVFIFAKKPKIREFANFIHAKIYPRKVHYVRYLMRVGEIQFLVLLNFWSFFFLLLVLVRPYVYYSTCPPIPRYYLSFPFLSNIYQYSYFIL